MNKSVFFGIFLIILILLGGCTQSNPTQNQAAQENLPGPGNSQLQPSGKFVESDFEKKAKELNATLKEEIYSIDLIEEAYEKGELNQEQYFLQAAYAYFEPELIDSKYAGTSEEISPDAFLWSLKNEFDSLSPEAKEKLEKYLLSPSDPKSYWYSSEVAIETQGQKKDIISFAGIMLNKHPVTGKEYDVSSPAGFDAQKTIVETAFEKSFNKYSYEIALTEPTDWVHLFIQDLPKYDGLQYIAEDNGSYRCIILINKGLNEKTMKTTVSHELFHCFQDYVPLKYEGDEMWLMEATAVLAEEVVYPTENTEHVYDNAFFRKLNRHLFDKSGSREYGSYLWFFYLYQKEGKSPDFLRDLLLHASLEGTKITIKELNAFNDKFHEYALWNYNTAPFFKYYQDAAGLPDKVPHGKSLEFDYLMPDKKESKPINVEKGGIYYFDFQVAEDSIKRVEFDFTELNPTPNPETGIQLIYEIGGVKQYMDVSDQSKIQFCPSRPNEKITSFLFIFSNSNLDEKLEGPLKIDTTGECEPVWSGYVRMSWDHPSSYDWSGITGDPTVETRNQNGNYFSREELIYDKENDEFLLKSRSTSLRQSDISLITYNHECGNQTKYDADVSSGSYYMEEDTFSKPFYVLQDELSTRIEKNDKTGKYELNTGIGMGKKMHYYSLLSYTKKPCFGEGISTPGEYYAPQETSSEGEGREPQPNDFPPLEMSADGKRLTGSGNGYFDTGWGKFDVRVDMDFYYG